MLPTAPEKQDRQDQQRHHVNGAEDEAAKMEVPVGHGQESGGQKGDLAGTATGAEQDGRQQVKEGYCQDAGQGRGKAQ